LEYPVVSPDQAQVDRVVIVAARNEADRIATTIEALEQAFAGARLIVADDGSTDATARLATEAGAELSTRQDGRRHRRGKGGAVSAAAESALSSAAGSPSTTFIFCDGDVGESARRLPPLADAVESGRCDLAIAKLVRSEGGGFGIALGFARWATRSLAALDLEAPLCGVRAVRADKLGKLLPLAPGYGMEIGMNVDASRAGLRVSEIELDLTHRVTRRTPADFLHRARQLVDFLRVYLSRRAAKKNKSG